MQNGRKWVKLGHTVSSAGLIGGILAYMTLLVVRVPESLTDYLQMRQSIKVISDWMIFPSLAVALVTGLLAMVVHTPFLDRGWVWIKAALGVLSFKGVLIIVHAKASYAAVVAADMVAGAAPPDALDSLLRLEWGTLLGVLVILLANFVLAIWRPRLVRFGQTKSPNAADSKAEDSSSDVAKVA